MLIGPAQVKTRAGRPSRISEESPRRIVRKASQTLWLQRASRRVRLWSCGSLFDQKEMPPVASPQISASGVCKRTSRQAWCILETGPVAQWGWGWELSGSSQLKYIWRTKDTEFHDAWHKGFAVALTVWWPKHDRKSMGRPPSFHFPAYINRTFVQTFARHRQLLDSEKGTEWRFKVMEVKVRLKDKLSHQTWTTHHSHRERERSDLTLDPGQDSFTSKWGWKRNTSKIKEEGTGGIWRSLI